MITIMVLGLDQYITGHFSTHATEVIAKILGVEEEQIIFYAPESNLFFKGVEQTSWQGLIIVNLPTTLVAHEAELAEYLLEATSDFLLNLSVEFRYFNPGKTYERVNPEYQRFINDNNLEADEEDEEVEPDDLLEDDDEVLSDGQDLFLGDAFASLNQPGRDKGPALDEEPAKKSKPVMECCEGDDCECGENDCECAPGEQCDCHDGHHHH